MNLKGSHLLFLVMIIFGIYYIITNVSFTTRELIGSILVLEVALLSIGAISWGYTPCKSIDPRTYGNDSVELIGYINKGYEDSSIRGALAIPKIMDFILYSGNIFLIVSLVPVALLIVAPNKILKFLDKHLSIKA